VSDLRSDLEALVDEWEALGADGAAYEVRALLDKHAPEPDARGREYLTWALSDAYYATGGRPAEMADAILAAGWRRA
jgi:hypothetical protein